MHLLYSKDVIMSHSKIRTAYLDQLLNAKHVWAKLCLLHNCVGHLSQVTHVSFHSMNVLTAEDKIANNFHVLKILSYVGVSEVRGTIQLVGPT